MGKRKFDSESRPLQSSKRQRVAAKSVMGQSANDCVTNFIRNNSNEWSNYTRNEELRTDQEWCHLHGHGDGGEEKEGNFVAGSKHCNTEQLAIEEGVRTFSHRENYQVDFLGAKITAYTFPGSDYKIAKVIRYKIIDRDLANIIPKTNSQGICVTKPAVIFDHIYDAQSESFNRHEFRILKYTVVLNIAAYLEATYPSEFENEFKYQAKRIWKKYNDTDISTSQIKNLRMDFFPADDR